MRLLTKEDIEKLKQIHLETTGELLTDQEALEMGTKIVSFLRIATKPIPKETAESDE